MITVTFPTRPAVASPSEPPFAVASRPQGQGFGGVFELLQPGSGAPEPGPAAQDSTAPMAEAPPDQPISESARLQDDHGREPTAADMGTPVPVAKPDQNRIATGEILPDAPPESMVPVPGLPDAPILMTHAANPVPTTGPESVMPVPAGSEPGRPGKPAPALPAVAGQIVPAATTLPPQAGAAVPRDLLAGPPGGPVPPPPETDDSSPQGPAPTVPPSSGPVPAAAVDGYEIIDGAGLILLAGDRPETGRKPPLPAGVPAFWAAREVAEADAAPAEDTAPQPTTPPLIDVRPQRPAAQTVVESAALLPAREESLQQREPTALPAPAFPQTAAVGPAPGPPLAATLPPPAPAGPTTALPPQVPAQLAAAIAARPERPLELRLAAVELGGMTLNLRQDGDILRVVLQADRPDTLDLLRRNGDILLEELRLAGFSGADLSFADDGGARDRPEPAQPRQTPQTDTLRMPPAPQSSTALHTAQGLDLRL